MGGFFGAASKRDVVLDVFFGVDYHSHLGTRRAGMASIDETTGFQREIHNIENSPFRTKFAGIADDMKGCSCIGCISDSDPQPILIRSNHGVYAIATTGVINNSDEIVNSLIESGKCHFGAMTGGKVNSTELVAALINQKETLVDGIRYAQDNIEGSMSILILCEDGSLIAARDKLGRLPVHIGRNDDGCCVSFEEFAYEKLGYSNCKELGPREIVKVTSDGVEVLSCAEKKKRICAFLWSYYGYPSSSYEGINVEVMRARNGAIMAREEMKYGLLGDVDYVCGVPDSGTPHAIGYANESRVPFARPFIKYTPTWPRSFMPPNQNERSRIAKMKQIPVHDLIQDKKLLFVDDSIVRGTQIRETVEFLYENGAREVHMRSACPPIMYGCKYLNFSRNSSDMDLLARRTIMELEGEEGEKHIEEYSNGHTERGRALRKAICEKLHLASLEFQSLEGVIEAIGLDPSEVCTYCWNGRE